MVSIKYVGLSILVLISIIVSYLSCNHSISTFPVPQPVCRGFEWISKEENLRKLEHLAVEIISEGRLGKFTYNDGVITMQDSPISLHLHGKWIIVNNPKSNTHGFGLKNGNCENKSVVKSIYKEIKIGGITDLCFCTGSCLDDLPESERLNHDNPLESLQFIHQNFQFIENLLLEIEMGSTTSNVNVTKINIDINITKEEL
jgi:hypothetical protein